MSKATPRPWKINNGHIMGKMRDGMLRYIATIDPYDDLEEDQANAALIVRAVNMHDRLVEALKRLTTLHAAWCDRVRLGKGTCNCGVDWNKETHAMIMNSYGRGAMSKQQTVWACLTRAGKIAKDCDGNLILHRTKATVQHLAEFTICINRTYEPSKEWIEEDMRRRGWRIAKVRLTIEEVE